MSICVTSLVWMRSRAEGSTLLTALAIADFADDEGAAFPSVATLARKARTSERTVQYALTSLQDLGELLVERGTGPHGCNRYLIQVQNLRGANSAGVQNTTERGCNPLHPNHHKNHQKKKEERPARVVAVAGPADSITLTVDADLMASWRDAFPAIVVETEVARAGLWLTANPKNRKSNYERFLLNWLTRAQDKAPAAGRGYQRPAPQDTRQGNRQAMTDWLFGQKGEPNVVVDAVATEVH